MSIYPRTEFEMSQEDLDVLLDAMKATPVMMIGSYVSGMDRQERANAAWENLGKKMGFDHMTVRPVEGKDMKHFSAVPSETESQREERERNEAEAARQKRIAEIGDEIDNLSAELKSLS